jgi:transposase
MKKCGEALVGIDTAKARNAVAFAEAARDGEVARCATLARSTTRQKQAAKLVRSLSGHYAKLYFCYEAGPTG